MGNIASSVANFINDPLGIKDTTTKIQKTAENTYEMSVDGIKYVVSKITDTLGEAIITISRQIGDTTVTIFKDTERNAFMFLGNTAQNLANAYIDTEQNITQGIRSPVEKAIHVIDDQLDQAQVVIYDIQHNIITTMQLIAVVTFLVILLVFIFLAKKEYIMKLLDMLQKIVNKFL